MSTRSFADGRKLIGKKTPAKGRLDAAVLAGMEPLEQRQMLNAAVLGQSPTPQINGSTPLAPIPGQTIYANGNGTSNAWQWNSALTPNTVNDLVLNVTAFDQNYTGCCEGTNNSPGNTGSVNSGRLLTNGLTQNQIGGFPASGFTAATGSGNNSDSSSGASVISQTTGSYYLSYNLGAAPGQTPSSTGYDINEVDVLSGHQDSRTAEQVDIQVQYVGGNATDWFSLSNGNQFTFSSPTRGSAQMAIQNSGAPMAKNVRSVKFVASNGQTWFRELVVTGVASSSLPSGVNAPGTPVAVADPTPGAIDVVFNPSPGGAQNYIVQRALVSNGNPGAFTNIAGLVTSNNPTTYVDTTGAAGSIYVYRIIAQNNGSTATSGNSNNFATPLVGAEAHYYNMAYWEGPTTVNQGVAVVQLNWSNGAPAAGIRGSVNSAVITGKVTPSVSGVYTFYSNTDDDGYLYVNGVLVSADPGGHGQRNAASAVDVNNNPLGFAKPVNLNAGTAYNFVLLEHNSGGGAGANLVWKTPSSDPAGSQLQVVPSDRLSPLSSAPAAPTALTVDTLTLNSNFVNFTFTANNNAVVHYILQRALASSPTVWSTISQIDPGSNVMSGNNLDGALPHTLMTIQDSMPLPGTSYVYRVAALNYDGFAATPTVAPTLTSTADIVSPPTGTVTLATATDNAGLAAGTYFVKYAWLNSAGGITAASAETSIVTAAVGDVTVALPAAPAGAVNANVYISNATGQERLVGNVLGGATLTVKGLPITSATSAPTANSAGLSAGTYFVAYTWVGNESTVTGESSYASFDNTTRLLTTNETSIILASTNDITVGGFPTAPTGVSGVNVYIGTAAGAERFAGTVAPTGSLLIKSLPLAAVRGLPASQVNNTALVSGTVAALVPAVSGINAPGVEIHAYNMELFRRTSQSTIVDASAVAQNGLAAEYIAQTSNQTYTNLIYGGPIDRDYGAVAPNINPLPAPSSPDPTKFPDIERIHTESFSQAFTGVLTPSVSGIYTIISSSDDDGFVWLDGTLISADPGGHGQQDTLFPTAIYTNAPSRTQDTLIPVQLNAGQSYNLTMFMGNTGGGSGAHLKWVEPAPNGSAGMNGQVSSANNIDAGGALISFNDPLNGGITRNYNNYTVFITSGPGSGQAGTISNYNTTTKTGNVNVLTNGNQSLWTTVPTNASRFTVAWVAAVPMKGSDSYFPDGSQLQGGLSLHQDIPYAASWSTTTGAVSVTTSASAAQNLTISQVSPTAGVSLTWSDVGVSELWYEVQRSTDGVNFTTIGTTPMNVGTTFTDPSAANAFGNPAISYFYRVRGVNFDGSGPFAPVVNTNNGVSIVAPQIAQIIQGAPGTAGLVFSGGSANAGGLDVQYATVTGAVTGTFTDATPLGLPFNTFDYQVTGLVASQQYQFRVRNLPGGNNSNTALFGSLINFTPSGGVQEAFGTPGSSVVSNPSLPVTGGFTSAGDLAVFGNTSLTSSTGVPAPVAPTAAPVLGNPQDLTTPFLNPTVTSTADAPAPSDAGTFATSAQNLFLSGVNSVFMEYTWVTANGETLPFSTPKSFTIPTPGAGYLLTYSIPTAPAGFGIVNANIYIGSSSVPSAELLKATVTPGTSVLISTFATAGSKSAPTASTTGIPNGTYYVQYTWSNTAGQQTGPITEFPVTLTNLSNDVTITLPTPPAGATNSSVYIGTAPGAERLIGSAGVSSTPSVLIRGLPASTSATPPTTNAAGLPAGTYFVQYTWNTNLPNENTTGESLVSPLTSIVITAGQDVTVAVPAAPNTGTGNANIYLGTSATSLFIAGQTAPNSTFTARTLPTSGNRPTIPGTVLSGPATVTSAADTVANPTTTLAIAGQTPDASGSTIVPGTYYLQYTWIGSGGGQTAASPEQSFVVTATSDVTLNVPAGPSGSGNANIYIGTASGAERLLQQVAPSTQPTLKSLPATNAAVVPTTSTIGFAAGTYYIAYTWTSGSGLETAGSTEQTIVVPASSDILVVPPAGPVGSGNARVYIGSVSGQEFLAGSVAALGTLTVKTLPTINSRIVPVDYSQNYRLKTPASALQLVNNNGSQQGGAFNLGENIAGFNTSFDFVLQGNTSADGFGLVFTPDGRSYTGGGGGSLSYQNTTPGMARSFGIFFDTYNGNGTGRTGLGINGNRPGDGNGASAWLDLKTSSTGAPTGVAITNGTAQDQRPGDVFSVNVSYDNSAHIVTETVYDLTLKNRGVNNGFTTTYSIDLVATIGMPAAFVGFVGASGGVQGEKDILNWTYSNSTAIQLDTITGTAGVDTITLTKDADGQHIDWTLNGNPQVFQETISSTNGLTINGLGANDVINLNYANGNPLPNTLKLNGVFTINGFQGTNPLAGTNVDLNTSTVFIPYGAPATDPMALVRSALQQGFNGQAWTGTATPTQGAIRSSAAAANKLLNTIGYADSADVANPAQLAPNTIELRYTAIGDTNLDGTVGLTDLTTLLQNYTTGTKWDQGQITYGTTVGLTDLTTLLQQYNRSVASPSATPAATPAAAPASTSQVASATPAPTANSSLSPSGSSVTLSASSSPATNTADTGGKKKVAKVKKHK